MQKALLAMSDAGAEIQQNAFNALEGHNSLEDTLKVMDEQVAYLASLLPLLRHRLSRKEQLSPDAAETDFEKEQHRINSTMTDLVQSVVLVPVLDIVVT